MYSLASFVKHKVSVGVWVYLGFYLVPLVYISSFVPVPYWLDDCSFAILHILKLILVINILDL